MTTAHRLNCALASALCAIALFIFVPTASALSPGTGAGPNYCAQYGSSNSPYSFENVYACATTASNGRTPFDSNGDQSFQCVELSARFLWAEYGISATGISDGADLVSTVHSEHPSIAVGSPGAGRVPAPGDVISLGPGGGADPTYGHTAVVVSSDPNTGGFTIMSQNDPEGRAGEQSLSVDLTGGHNGRVAFGGSWTPATWLALSGTTGGTPLHTAAALIPNDGASGYVLDGYGGLHAFGNAPAVTSPVSWPGWDIARGIAVAGPGKGYILDGYGGLHPFGGARPLSGSPYWSGWDIARGIALCPGGAGGYVLDGYGGVHPFGSATALSGGPYWSGWDIARGIVVNSTCTGGYVLDGYGGVHPVGDAPAVNTSAYWSGWDIARSVTLATDTSGYVLDGYGGIHPFAASGTPTPPAVTGATYQGGSDIYRAIAIDGIGGIGVQVTAYQNQAGSLTGGQVSIISEPRIHTAAALIPNDGASGYVLDGYGGLHAFGNAPAVTSPVSWPGWDIARGIAVAGPGKGYILDGYGGLHPFGGARPLSGSPYWSGWDIARGIALCPGGAGGYVLDGYGGVHPFGSATALSGGPYWSGWDIARGIVVNSTCTGGYVLDGYGGVHPVGDAPAVNTSAYWSGWDIARSIALVTNKSGYVLDGYGAVHPFAATGTPTPPTLTDPLYDSASTDLFDALVYDRASHTGIAASSGYTNGVYRLAKLM